MNPRKSKSGDQEPRTERRRKDHPVQPQPNVPDKEEPPEGYAEEKPGKRSDQPPQRSK